MSKRKDFSKRKIPEESGKDRLEKLKGDNKQLRKLVKHLRKENKKLVERQKEVEYIVEEEADKTFTDLPAQKDKCPKCNSYEVKIIKELRPGKDYFFCKNSECGARGPVNEDI